MIIEEDDIPINNTESGEVIRESDMANFVSDVIEVSKSTSDS